MQTGISTNIDIFFKNMPLAMLSKLDSAQQLKKSEIIYRTSHTYVTLTLISYPDSDHVMKIYKTHGLITLNIHHT